MKKALQSILLPLMILIVSAETQQEVRARQGSATAQASVGLVDGEPRFQMRGEPFFAHTTAFFYNRIPRDEWGASLVRLKEMGINTVDLYIAWNWHEPEEGQLDFDGRTNPRRDVKGLLEMVDEMGFAVIVRPGPVILNEWRNGGYPDWLLARPEFGMAEAARLDGHYPPLSGLGANNSEEASRQWMANETHLKYTRKWFGEVMRELLLRRQAGAGGNLIAIQLDDDQAINRANFNGPEFWKYMNTLAGYLREAGATAPLYINPTDMRVSAAGAPHGIGAMGQWYFNFGSDPALRWEDTATLQFYTETLKTQPRFPPMIIEYQAGWYGTGDDTYAKTADPTNTLLSSRVMMGQGLQGLNYFPLQDTLYPAGYEVPWANHYYIWESALTLDRRERPRAEAVHRNGRLVQGLGRELAGARKAADLGLIYPISSYEQAALTRDEIMRISGAQMRIQQYCQLQQVSVEYLDLEFQPVEHLLRHKALLLPLIDEKAAAQGREEISAANEPAAGSRAGNAPAGIAGGKRRLSETARLKLIEYVRAGGRLIVTPELPEAGQFAEIEGKLLVLPDLWRSIPIEPGAVGRDELIADVSRSSEAFGALLRGAGVSRGLSAAATTEPAGPLFADRRTVEPELHASLLTGGARGRDSYGFLSAANFDSRRSMRVKAKVAARGSAPEIELPEFTIRPRDAVLLPLRVPLAPSGIEEIYYATAELQHREIANGRIRLRFYAPGAAEIALRLRHAPEGIVTIDRAPVKFEYAAASGLLTLKLGGSTNPGGEREIEIVYEALAPVLSIQPARLILGETNAVVVEVANRATAPLRGRLVLTASRLFRRERFELATAVASRQTARFRFEVPIALDAVTEDPVALSAALATDDGQVHAALATTAEIQPRFAWRIFASSSWQLRADTSQPIEPPLIYTSDATATQAQFNIRLTNHTGGEITLSRRSRLVDSLPLKLGPDEEYLSTYNFSFAPGSKSALNPFAVTITDGRATEVARVTFVALRRGEAVAFAYDIDRDGFEDYVLENDHLRLILSPRAGARAFALIDKRTGANVFTSVGGLRDKFVELDPLDPTRNPRRKRGAYGTFNRAYSAEILEGMGARVQIKLACDAPDVHPAGARIERTITLRAGDAFFLTDYRITPNPGTADGAQAFWAASSIPIGDPLVRGRRFVTSDGSFDFMNLKSRSIDVQAGWLGAEIAPDRLFAILWRPAEARAVEVDMKDFSSLLNVKFVPFPAAAPQSYRLATYLGPMMTAPQLAAARARMIGQ
ncbi:MAG: beta-galactosidase [Blastocatellia bacterium]